MAQAYSAEQPSCAYKVFVMLVPDDILCDSAAPVPDNLSVAKPKPQEPFWEEPAHGIEWGEGWLIFPSLLPLVKSSMGC